MAHWFKFWTSAREDSKLRSLTDFEFRYWMMLLCLAAEDDGCVSLADREMVCIEVSLLDENGEPCVGALDTILAKLVRRRLVTIEDDVLRFNGWDYRQMKPSDRPEQVKERVAKHRERKRNADVTRYVTPTEAELDTEAERERDSAREIPSPKANLPDCFKAEVERGGITKSYAGHLMADLEGYAGRWPSIPANRGKLGAAIRNQCGDCDGNEAQARKCATAIIRHARKVHEDKGDPFAVDLFLYHVREGAR